MNETRVELELFEESELVLLLDCDELLELDDELALDPLDGVELLLLLELPSELLELLLDVRDTKVELLELEEVLLLLELVSLATVELELPLDGELELDELELLLL